VSTISTDTLSGFASRDYVLPAGHRLIVRSGQGDVALHRMGENAITRNYDVTQGEEFAVMSDRETKWRVGPAVGIVTVKIENAAA